MYKQRQKSGSLSVVLTGKSCSDSSYSVHVVYFSSSLRLTRNSFFFVYSLLAIWSFTSLSQSLTLSRYEVFIHTIHPYSYLSLSQSSSTATSVAITSSSTSSLSSTSTSTSTSTSPTTTVTLQQGPVGQPAPTVGTPGGPTPYTYTTVANGVTNVLTAVFTPTSPATTPVTATAAGTILNYSSWLAIYGPTHTPSASAGYALHPCSFPLTLVVLLGMLNGGMLFVWMNIPRNKYICNQMNI